MTNQKEYSRKSDASPQEMQATRAKKITEESVLRSDGSKHKLLVIDSANEKSIDFIKVQRGGVDMQYTPYEALLLLTFLKTMRHDNIIISSIDDIKADTGIGRNSVMNALEGLRNKNIIRNIRQSVYMINPLVASSVSPQYLPALKKAWKSGKIQQIESDMRAIDAKKREITRQNAEKCRAAGLQKHITVPELDDARNEDEEYEILHKKSLEEIVMASISRGEVI